MEILNRLPLDLKNVVIDLYFQHKRAEINKEYHDSFVTNEYGAVHTTGLCNGFKCYFNYRNMWPWHIMGDCLVMVWIYNIKTRPFGRSNIFVSKNYVYQQLYLD